MQGRNNSHGRVAELDGLRGLAIAAVVFYHYTGASTPLACATGAQYGYLGVTLFFVLSGYLITGILLSMRSRSDYFRPFYARRALRIFPPYYLFLVVGLLLAVSIHGAQPTWEWLTCFFYLSANIHVNPSPAIPFAVYTGLAVTWSLSVEEQFYLLWAPLVRWVKDKALVPALCAFIILGPALRWVIQVDPSLRLLNSLANFDKLALGSLTCIAIQRWKPTLAQTRWLLAVGVMLFLAVLYAGGFTAVGRHNPLDASVAAFMFASLLAFVVLRKGSSGGVCRILRVGPLLELGKVSYTLYLIHQPVMVVVDTLMSNLIPSSHFLERLVARPIALVLAFLLAEASWRFFEAPILRLKDRLFPRSPIKGVVERPREASSVASVPLVTQ